MPETITPSEEARSLREHPLPPETITLIAEDRFLPSRIWQQDFWIAQKQEEIAEMAAKRKQLMDRAVELGILEDENCQIRFKERTTRILDPVLFRAMFPAAYAAIIAHERAVIDEKENHIGEVIPLGLADKLAGEDAVTALCEIKVTQTPFVSRKLGVPRDQ